MKGGFSFCGVDIATIGLEYVPELETMYVYSPAETNVHDEMYEGHNGGYFYGAHKSPKVFDIRCVFEEKSMTKGIMSKIHDLFRVGRSGKLIFNKRPWVYYYATVVSNPELSPTNYMNGVIRVTMKAYYPFGRSDMFYCELGNKNFNNIMENSAMPESAEMMPPVTFEEVDAPATVLILNPGTERASVGIACSGNAPDGLVIRNKTTDQRCKLSSYLKYENTSDVNKEVFIDGMNGKTILRNQITHEGELAFLYHEYGFIELEPGYPAVRNVYIEYTGTNKITVTNILREDCVGKYIYANEKWHKILEQDEHELTVQYPIGSAGTEKSMIVRLNEISISSATEFHLNRISFIYKPTFS